MICENLINLNTIKKITGRAMEEDFFFHRPEASETHLSSTVGSYSVAAPTESGSLNAGTKVILNLTGFQNLRGFFLKET
jgi:hypothetical protein